MTTLFVRHTVSNYDHWRKVYDSVGPVQKKAGVIAEAVYRGTDNPNDVTVTHEFASLAAAAAFAGGDDLKSAMRTAGIAGAPTIWFAEKA